MTVFAIVLVLAALIVAAYGILLISGAVPLDPDLVTRFDPDDPEIL